MSNFLVSFRTSNRLRSLRASHNYNLYGYLNFSVLSGAGYLVDLDLSYNKFSNTIPTSISICSQLRYLDISSNLFVGELPEQISSLQQLQYLNISHNLLTGSLPPSLCSLHHLRRLWLRNNDSDYQCYPSCLKSIVNVSDVEVCTHYNATVTVISAAAANRGQFSRTLLIILTVVLIPLGVILLITLLFYYYVRRKKWLMTAHIRPYARALSNSLLTVRLFSPEGMARETGLESHVVTTGIASIKVVLNFIYFI